MTTGILITNAAVLGAAAILLWLSSLPLRDASIVDRFWGMYFVLVAGTTLVVSDTTQPGWLLFALTAIWGLRLSLYLTWRNWGGGEDYRYQKMRRYWGPRFWLISLLSVFLLQAALAWVVSLPLQLGIAADHESVDPALMGAGLIVWAVGLTFESVGDWQLARFKSNPANKGRVLDTGLWRYTRHPNYFGDVVVWWGLHVAAIGSGAPWWSIAGPLLMTYLLMRVSGVPMLERQLRKTRPEYADYVARTSAFVPWPPKSSSS